MKRFILKLAFLALGLFVFIWLIKETGIHAILDTLSKLGWNILFLIFPFLTVFVIDTFGWKKAFHPRTASRIPFTSLLTIRWAGESFNQLVPSGHLGGEAVKVYLLKKRGLSAVEATSSVVISKTIQTLCHAIFIGVGAGCFVMMGHLNPQIRDAMLVISAGTFAFSLTLFRLQKTGMFTTLFHVLDRFSIVIQRLNRRRRSLLRLDLRIKSFYHKNPRQFVGCTLAFMGGWMLDPLEIYLVSHLLDMPLTLIQALGIEAFIAVAKGVGFFVPGALGIQETGILFLCRLAGVSDIFGVTYAMIRRFREILFALAGWYWLHLFGLGLGLHPHVVEDK